MLEAWCYLWVMGSWTYSSVREFSPQYDSFMFRNISMGRFKDISRSCRSDTVLQNRHGPLLSLWLDGEKQNSDSGRTPNTTLLSRWAWSSVRCRVSNPWPVMSMNAAQHKIIHLLKTFPFAQTCSSVFVYLTCGPEMPKGWTPLTRVISTHQGLIVSLSWQEALPAIHLDRASLSWVFGPSQKCPR